MDDDIFGPAGPTGPTGPPTPAQVGHGRTTRILLISTAVVMALAGLVVVGFFVVLFVGMSQYGSNK
jgi:hypothetical protein